MSATSTRRDSLDGRALPPPPQPSLLPSKGCARKIVPPQQVTDPTVLESVAGFISDVVPTAYLPSLDVDEQIQWAHFEYADLSYHPKNQQSSAAVDTTATALSPPPPPPPQIGGDIPSPPLLLILGYTSGVQIWAVLANGDATEVSSWRCGNCRFLRILPNPKKVSSEVVVDLFAATRPLIVSTDSNSNYSTLVFRSLKADVLDPVKHIQFHKQISNVYANRRHVLVTFSEKIAIIDAFTLESRGTITGCYQSPGLQINPIALGSRWLAYAEKSLTASNRSGGGCAADSVQSYTASVIHAAKTFSRGIRDLTETVTGSLTNSFKSGMLPASYIASMQYCDSNSGAQQNCYGATAGGVGGGQTPPKKGVITIVDLEHTSSTSTPASHESIVAHFVAHKDAIVHMCFDPSGVLLLTADSCGHDFHLFRIHPHPCGAHLAAVQHLYTLHRGDTSAKVQDICFASDSRWVGVSTLRGTTHVFPITPYGGVCNVRTHTNIHVVNKFSRFQRSAGLAVEGRCFTPASVHLHKHQQQLLAPYYNPRLPPFVQPTVTLPLAQIRQPLYMHSRLVQNHSATAHESSSATHQSDDGGCGGGCVQLRLVAMFAPPRVSFDGGCHTKDAAIGKSSTVQCKQRRVVESLFVMSCNGTLLQYDLEPAPVVLRNTTKDRVCNETPITLKATAKAQWPLLQQRQFNVNTVMDNDSSQAAAANQQPMLNDCVLRDISNKAVHLPEHYYSVANDQWLSQVEIITHMGPHRRLWMGPQFTFKTYTLTSGSVVETRPVDIRRSKPINMPVSRANTVMIEASSANSCEQLLLEAYQRTCEETGNAGEKQLIEELADAMRESPILNDGNTTTTTTTSSDLSVKTDNIVQLYGVPQEVLSSSTTTTTMAYNNVDKAQAFSLVDAPLDGAQDEQVSMPVNSIDNDTEAIDKVSTTTNEQVNRPSIINSVKKVRKPKVKLGVKITSKEDRSDTNVLDIERATATDATSVLNTSKDDNHRTVCIDDCADADSLLSLRVDAKPLKAANNDMDVQLLDSTDTTVPDKLLQLTQNHNNNNNNNNNNYNNTVPPNESAECDESGKVPSVLDTILDSNPNVMHSNDGGNSGGEMHHERLVKVNSDNNTIRRKPKRSKRK